MPPINKVRGEVELTMGEDTFALACRMDDLARLSSETNCATIQELYQRLIGAELSMTLTALRRLTISCRPDGQDTPIAAPEAGERAAAAFRLTDMAAVQGAFADLLTAFTRPAKDETPGAGDAPEAGEA